MSHSPLVLHLYTFRCSKQQDINVPCIYCCLKLTQILPLFFWPRRRRWGIVKSFGLITILTARSRVLLEKLTGSPLVKKYGTLRFITALTTARHLSLSWTRLIQSVPSFHLLKTHLNIIQIYIWVFQAVFFPHVFPTKTLYTPLFSPYVLHASPISFLSIWSPEKYLVRCTDH